MKGEIEVAVVSDDPARFAEGATVLLGERLRPVKIRSSRKQNARTIVAFEGVDDRTGAELLSGATLYIDSSAARKLAPGEYWDHDLLGCVVVTTSGEEIGVVEDVLHQPAGELLAVGRHLIPLIGDVVRDVVPGARITIEPLPGLLD